jgi:VWFA-related protein
MPIRVLLLASLLCSAVSAVTHSWKPVFVSASFLGKNRMFIEDLSPDEVRVYENGKPRTIEFLAGREVSVAYGILFDQSILPQPFDDPRLDANRVSTSMAAMNVAFQVLDQALGRQIGWVGVYEKDLRYPQDYSADTGRLKDAIQALRGHRTLDESFLYGALFNSIQKLSQRNEKRRVLILFIHTMDMATADKIKPLKNLLSASNVEFFVAGFAPKTGSRASSGLPPEQNEAAIRELASVTAGNAYFTYLEGIEGLGRRISNQIRTFYTIGFEAEAPANPVSTLKIECTRPGVKVTTHPVIPNLQ